MRILVTGGTGFVGSNITIRALHEGHTVLVFDNLSRAGSERNLQLLRDERNVTFRHGDIRSNEEVRACVSSFKPEVVFHLAGQVAMTRSIACPITDFAVNAQGTLYLLEAVRNHSPEALFAYASTNKVYGDLAHIELQEQPTRYSCPSYPAGFDELLPLNFHSPYGCSKGAADQYVLDYHRLFGLRTIVFRHSSIYGGRQFPTFDQGWVGWFCGQALLARDGHGTPFSVSGTGKQVRDLLHVDDATSLYLLALHAPSIAYGQAFNIGGGMNNSLSIIELLQNYETMLDTQVNYFHVPNRESDQAVFVADTTKADRMLGWKPTVSWRQGLLDMIEWMKVARAKA